MFRWMRTRKIERLAKEAESYSIENYIEAPPAEIENAGGKFSRRLDIRYSLQDDSDSGTPQVGEEKAQFSISPQVAPTTSGIRYSRRVADDSTVLRDNYNSEIILSAMRGLSSDSTFSSALQTLERSRNMSFIDAMLEYISKKQLRDTDVYKAAQVDRRLFSKMVSDRAYKPAKDTCVALCLALKLNLAEASDLLSRAGYTLSHSSKRDIILEFFFKEQVYNITDINEILFRLGQKPLGR